MKTILTTLALLVFSLSSFSQKNELAKGMYFTTDELVNNEPSATGNSIAFRKVTGSKQTFRHKDSGTQVQVALFKAKPASRELKQDFKSNAPLVIKDVTGTFFNVSMVYGESGGEIYTEANRIKHIFVVPLGGIRYIFAGGGPNGPSSSRSIEYDGAAVINSNTGDVIIINSIESLQEALEVNNPKLLERFNTGKKQKRMGTWYFYANKMALELSKK
jgi:hypothetical protein